jgi:hypothetical protein
MSSCVFANWYLRNIELSRGICGATGTLTNYPCLYGPGIIILGSSSFVLPALIWESSVRYNRRLSSDALNGVAI